MPRRSSRPPYTSSPATKAARIPRDCARSSRAPASCGLVANITSSGTSASSRCSSSAAQPSGRYRARPISACPRPVAAARTPAAPDGCLRDHSASQGRGCHHDPQEPARTPIFLALHDPSPLAGLKLVRPRPLRGCGRSSLTPPARRREPGQLRRRSHKNSQAQPGDTVKVAGPMTHALLTQLALMGAADRVERPRRRRYLDCTPVTKRQPRAGWACRGRPRCRLAPDDINLYRIPVRVR
jgi:hypothetical protein